MKGFKKDGKFRPTENKTKRLSSKIFRNKKSITTSGNTNELKQKKIKDDIVTCPNCKGTGELDECFYCGSENNCSYCKWTEGDELPQGKSVKECEDENLCCMCIGHGNKAGEINYYDVPQEDEHLLPHTKEYFKDGKYPDNDL